MPLALNILDIPGSAFLTYDFPPYRLFEFMIGICLARWMMLPRDTARPRLLNSFWASTAIFSTCVIVVASMTQAYRPLVSVLFIPGTVALIHWAVTREMTDGVRWLRMRPLVKLGEWSFALYLVHMLVCGQ